MKYCIWYITIISPNFALIFISYSRFKFKNHSQISLRWRHNGHDCVSNHQPRHCLLNRLFERRSKKTSKHRVTGLCEGNSPGTGEFPAQMARNVENVSIWWRHHVNLHTCRSCTWVMIEAAGRSIQDRIDSPDWNKIFNLIGALLYGSKILLANDIARIGS